MGKKYSKQGKKQRAKVTEHVRSTAQLFKTRWCNYMFNNSAVRTRGMWLDSAALLIPLLFTLAWISREGPEGESNLCYGLKIF